MIHWQNVETFDRTFYNLMQFSMPFDGMDSFGIRGTR